MALIILNLFSGGLYSFYWFYHQWDNVRKKTGESFNPALRTLFTIIFGYPLFRRYYKMAKEKGYSKNPPLALLFVLYVSAAISSFIFWPLGLLQYVIMVPVVHMINFYYKTEQSNQPMRSSFSTRELIFLAITISVIIIGVFLS